MGDEITKYLIVVGTSMFKFIGGPTIGKSFGFHFLVTAALTTLGTMLSVIIFSFLGGRVRDRIARRKRRKKNYRVFTKKKRRIVKIWTSFGIRGVAFLTPLLFTPIGGTLIAASFGVPRKKIIVNMFISALFWSVIFSFFIDILLDVINNWIHSSLN